VAVAGDAVGVGLGRWVAEGAGDGAGVADGAEVRVGVGAGGWLGAGAAVRVGSGARAVDAMPGVASGALGAGVAAAPHATAASTTSPTSIKRIVVVSFMAMRPQTHSCSQGELFR